ncbi:winged helix-turn-helix domain-containing protein [Streptomyces sp. NBC_01498]|uniref:ArsR/SmtB family transcription factor n=1 Tax=Streptomyces sp. NBC_01498 TaxID=2975870 RepID=UPI002E7BFBDF|nr:winged helix-turn-helix domain-containing protein [Streptomyces sp. NBC_01498]WTL25800.1 winged helix-turn-helix domain-containing protein [Streptomyces sp. NBC_01498]
MGWWQVDADTLAGSRFVVSPLTETVASLRALHDGRAAHPGERAWLDAHLPAYRSRLAADPVTALLVRSAFGRGWNADFITPTPTGEALTEQTFDNELTRIREVPPETVRADLLISLDGPLPAPLADRDDLAERAATLVEWVWAETVLPYWPRRRRLVEADIVARTAQLSRGGWASALGDMRRGMRWLGGNRLQISARPGLSQEIPGVRLMFVPVSPRQSWVSWDADRYAVVYPCAGVLAEEGTRPPVPEPLRALLGPGRAAVLALLGAPKSTTQLVALTGQGLGSVGRHLRVLLDAGLITRRRSGRSVLYFRTESGETLVGAAPPPGGGRA